MFNVVLPDIEQYEPTDTDKLDVLKTLYTDPEEVAYRISRTGEEYLVCRETVLAFIQMRILDSGIGWTPQEIWEGLDHIGADKQTVLRLVDLAEQDILDIISGTAYPYTRAEWDCCFGSKRLASIREDIYTINKLPELYVIPSPIFTDNSLYVLYKQHDYEYADAVIETIQLSTIFPLFKFFNLLTEEQKQTTGTLLYHLIKQGAPFDGVLRQFGIRPTNHITISQGTYIGVKYVTDAINAYFGTNIQHGLVGPEMQQIKTACGYTSMFSKERAEVFVEQLRCKYVKGITLSQLVQTINNRPKNVSAGRIGIIVGSTTAYNMLPVIRKIVRTGRFVQAAKYIATVEKLFGIPIFKE